jgi:hypothetical protein
LYLYSIHQTLRYLIATGGIDWAHPGSAIKQLAGATIQVTRNTIWAWTPSGYHLMSISGLIFALSPIALAVFVFNLTTLIRRTEFSIASIRVSRMAVNSMTLTMAFYLVSYAGWIAAGGPNVASSGGMQPLTQTEFSLLGLMVIVALLGANTANRLRRSRS